MNILDFNKFGDFNINNKFSLFYYNRALGELKITLSQEPVAVENISYFLLFLYNINISSSNQKKLFGTRTIQQLLDFCTFYNLVCIIPSQIIKVEGITREWFIKQGFNSNINKMLNFDKSVLYKIPD